MLEFEKKVILSENEYEFLKTHLYAACKNNVQVNHYYDTHDFELNRKRITCRIREKNGVCTATVKEHRLQGTCCSVENFRAVKDRYDDSLFLKMGILYQGSMETLRSTYELQPGIKIMLDRNSYLGTVDYELEIEYEKEYEYLADAELERIISELTEHKIPCDSVNFRNRIGSGSNKSARFFSRKGELAAGTEGWRT